jgi:hypothetical protein
MADMHEGEVEMELEDEFHEGELETEDESSLEGEGWLGAIGNVVGSLLGEGEEEYEAESAFESEDEGELFLGKIGKFLKKIAPRLGTIVGSAVGAPVGSMLAGLGNAAGEGEYEDEMETEAEGEQEMVHEIAAHELTHNEAVAEMMAEAASHEVHEGEAEAMAGAAAITVISPKDRRALRRILPHLVRGTAILTRILRRRRVTRPAVRAVPTIVRRTVKDLKKQAARGIPITRKRAARAAAKQVRRVLGSPKACATAIARNVKVSRSYKRPKRQRMRGSMPRRRRSAVR